MFTRLWVLLRGYGTTKEKLFFLASLAVLGIFILVVYVICQMVQGVQQISTDATTISEEDEALGIDALNEDQQAMTDSYNHAL
jgi:hypothetical protein